MPPPPQTWFAGQAPQLMKLQQPSLAGPQLNPSDAQVFGVHGRGAQTLGLPPAPQAWQSGQAMPQSSVPPHPSLAMPQSNPSPAQVFVVQHAPLTQV
jgi:hypothetical protein